MMAEALANFECKPCPVCHMEMGGLLINNGSYSVCNECGHEDLCPTCGGTGRVIDQRLSYDAWEPVEVPCDNPDCAGEVI